jgi:glucose/mannose transport system permease protein
MEQVQKSAIIIPAQKRRRLSADRIASLLVIAPSVIAIIIFVYGFIGWTGWVSVSKWRGINPDFSFAGWDNFDRIFGSSRFQTDLRNNIVFTIFFLIGCLGIGLLLATLLDMKIKGESFFRAVFLFPMALSFIVTGTVWQWLFAPGLPDEPTGLNLLAQRFGIPLYQDWSINIGVLPGWDPEFLSTKIGFPVAMLPVLVAAIWQMSGFTMAMYIAGLRGISEDLYEASRVDGATEWQIFRLIKLPLLQPITLSAIIILGHISLKIFDLIVTQTGGGPGNATEVPGMYMYEVTFKSNKYAEGAAISVVMLLLVALLIIPYLVSSMRSEVER